MFISKAVYSTNLYILVYLFSEKIKRSALKIQHKKSKSVIPELFDLTKRAASTFLVFTMGIPPLSHKSETY